MAARSPLLWFRVKDKAGRQWSIYLSCREISPELTVNAGITWREERTILVNVEPDSFEQDDTVLHELMHASLEDADLPAETEEYAVASSTPQLLHMLQKSVKLKWPKRPPGYNSLARYARRHILQ